MCRPHRSCKPHECAVALPHIELVTEAAREPRSLPDELLAGDQWLTNLHRLNFTQLRHTNVITTQAASQVTGARIGEADW